MRVNKNMTVIIIQGYLAQHQQISCFTSLRLSAFSHFKRLVRNTRPNMVLNDHSQQQNVATNFYSDEYEMLINGIYTSN